MTTAIKVTKNVLAKKIEQLRQLYITHLESVGENVDYDSTAFDYIPIENYDSSKSYNETKITNIEFRDTYLRLYLEYWVPHVDFSTSSECQYEREIDIDKLISIKTESDLLDCFWDLEFSESNFNNDFNNRMHSIYWFISNLDTDIAMTINNIEISSISFEIEGNLQDCVAITIFTDSDNSEIDLEYSEKIDLLIEYIRQHPSNHKTDSYLETLKADLNELTEYDY